MNIFKRIGRGIAGGVAGAFTGLGVGAGKGGLAGLTAPSEGLASGKGSGADALTGILYYFTGVPVLAGIAIGAVIGGVAGFIKGGVEGAIRCAQSEHPSTLTTIGSYCKELAVTTFDEEKGLFSEADPQQLKAQQTSDINAQQQQENTSSASNQTPGDGIEPPRGVDSQNTSQVIFLNTPPSPGTSNSQSDDPLDSEAPDNQDIIEQDDVLESHNSTIPPSPPKPSAKNTDPEQPAKIVIPHKQVSPIPKKATAETPQNVVVHSEKLKQIEKDYKEMFAEKTWYKPPVLENGGISLSFPKKQDVVDFCMKQAVANVDMMIVDKASQKVMGYTKDGQLYHSDGTKFKTGDTLSPGEKTKSEFTVPSTAKKETSTQLESIPDSPKAEKEHQATLSN